MMHRQKRNRPVAMLLAGAALAVAGGGQVSDAATEVGVTAAVNLDARSRLGTAPARVVTLGKTVIFNERFSTDGDGLVQLLLVDGTTFTIGPNSDLRIDEFVYNPDTGNAKVVATIAKGTFRFIGGQTSRRPGGATINTPAGTIGIRGAMVEGGVSGQNAAFSMVFGDEVVFQGSGGNRRLFRPGFTLEVSDGGRTTNVRPRTRQEAGSFLAGLAGNPGQNGGSDEQPTDSSVASSSVASVNSDRIDVPVPVPRPVQSSDIDEVSESITDVDDAADDEIREDIVQNPPSDPATPTDPADPTNPTDPTDPTNPETQRARVLLAPSQYTTFFGTIISNPGSRGLVGSTHETDFAVTFTKENGLLVGTTPSGGSISLPDLTGGEGDGGIQKFTVNPPASVPEGAVTVSGTAYAGRNDFAAYLLGIGGDPKKPFYVITGTETDPAFFSNPGTDIRAYSLTDDPIQGVGVPFFNPTYYGALSNTAETDLLIVERGGDNARALLTWIDISGSGSGQRSAIYVTAGGTSADTNGNTELWATRRGSFRGAADKPLVNMRGSSAYTVPGPNGQHAYGSNAENFVLGPGLGTGADAFFDRASDTCAVFTCSTTPQGYENDGYFGTHHVADLVSEIAQTAFSRTSRTVAGFMVGIGESADGGYQNPYTLAARSSPNFGMSLDASQSTVGGRAQVVDILDASRINSLVIAFGTIGSDFGPSAFVDDNVFGANRSNNRENTRIVLDNETSVGATVLSPGTYLVSGRAASLNGYRHCTECAFADWGWWGTRTIGDVANDSGTTRYDEYVHMGTWVAGAITDPAHLPTGPTSAHYRGTALANVVSGANQYIAAGDFSLDIDLSNRNGSLAITNLDNAKYSAQVSDASTSAQALFSGALTGDNGFRGAAMGALVDDGSTIAAGAIGQFHASGRDGQVAGTFMGRSVDLQD